MDKLNEHIEFLEMTESDPQLLVWLLELCCHRQDDWKQRAEAAEAEAEDTDKTMRAYSDQLVKVTSELVAAQAQLAELAKQKPIGVVYYSQRCGFHVGWSDSTRMDAGMELFTRAAPAADLVKQERVYQVRLPNNPDSAWFDASEEAYELTEHTRRRILFTRAAPAAVPDGWKLVPVEPRWEMFSADGCKKHHNGQPCSRHDNRRRIWSAMLAAVPDCDEMLRRIEGMK